MSKQLADRTIPGDTDDEQAEADRFEEQAAHALAAAARDPAGVAVTGQQSRHATGPVMPDPFSFAPGRTHW